MENTKSYQELVNELNETRLQLEEQRIQLEDATDTIEAIRSGEIDALVVNAKDGHQLYTLKSADQTYRIFIEQMTEGAVTLNQDGLILYSNSQFASLVCAPLEKVIGQQFKNFVAPAFYEETALLMQSAWLNHNRSELNLLSTGGSEIPVLLSLKTLDLDEGLSMSVIITDLTVQKETQELLQQKNLLLQEAQNVARHLNINLEKTVTERTAQLITNIQEKIKIEEELRSKQEQLTRILETMAEGVGIIDTQGNLTYANPMAQKILGLKYDEILKRTYHSEAWQNLRLDGTPLPDEEHPMSISLSTGEPVYDCEIAVQPPDGDRFFISINAAAIRDDKGNIVGGVGTFMDVTNRRMQQQQKDDFISIASHELRTPITSLKASLQLLNRMKENPSAQMLPALIDQANKSLNKVSVLISDLLNASKMNEGQLHLHKKFFSLGALIQDCCQQIGSEHIHNIIIEGDPELQVYADADKIDQVLVNFVNNAIKYAPQSRDITIKYAQVDAVIRVSVTDKGQGIPAEKLPHLFKRYYRADSSGIQYSGLGLGLYICAEIIKKHGGRVGVNSEIGQGSTFWFSLPVVSN